MNKLFLSTNGNGITRAAPDGAGGWHTERLLAERDVRCLAADAFHPGVFYAGTNGQGVLRSEDSGETWQPVGDPGLPLRALSASPTQPGRLFAGTKPARMFVSEDMGAAWKELNGFQRIREHFLWFSPAEPPDFRACVQAIAPSPTDLMVIVVGIEAGAVVRSADGGQTWSGHRRGAVRDCHSLVFHPDNPDWLYEGGGTGAAFSQDGGQTWTQTRQGLDRRYGWAAAGDPARPEIWYASFAPGPYQAHGAGDARAAIFRSTAGTGWEKLGGGLPDPLPAMPYALLADPDQPGWLFAGLSSGDIWLTQDYGDNWQKLPLNLGGIHRSLLISTI